jgi:hypothetical protein
MSIFEILGFSEHLSLCAEVLSVPSPGNFGVQMGNVTTMEVYSSLNVLRLGLGIHVQAHRHRAHIFES